MISIPNYVNYKDKIKQTNEMFYENNKVFIDELTDNIVKNLESQLVGYISKNTTISVDLKFKDIKSMPIIQNDGTKINSKSIEDENVRATLLRTSCFKFVIDKFENLGWEVSLHRVYTDSMRIEFKVEV